MKLLFALYVLFISIEPFSANEITSQSQLPLNGLSIHYINVQNASFDHLYEGMLNNSTQWTFVFQLDPLYEKYLSTNARLRVSANVTHKAVSVTILQPGAISSSFRIPTFPYRTDDQIPKRDFYSAERNICILDSKANQSISISVVLTSKSVVDIPFTLYINLTQDFLLKLNTPKNFTLSPNRPFYFRYQFGEHLKSVRILADTQAVADACMTLSVQTPVCPIFDHETSIHFQGIYQTLRSSGSIFVKRKYPFATSLVVVILAHPDDEECVMRDPLSRPHPRFLLGDPNKLFGDVSVSLKVVSDDVDYPSTALNVVCWLIPIWITVAICLISWATLKYKEKLLPGIEPTPTVVHGNSFWGRVATKLTSTFKVSDFGHATEKLGYGFSHYVNVTGTFYVIPVCQFAVYYYMVSLSTGDTDLCYYNYRCAQAVGPLQDLNHLISNVSFVVYGIIFILIVLQRRSYMRNYIRAPPDDGNIALVGNLGVRVYYGVEPNFGMFLALGAALIMEGCLSASYHMCPNEATFQFDTCFMYVIALLTMIQIREFRNIRFLTPYHTFAALAGIGVLTVIALIINLLIVPIERIWFCLAFLVIQFVITFLVSFNHVFVGFLREENTGRLITGWNICKYIFIKSTWTGQNIHVQRLVYPTITFAIGLICGICWLVTRWNFSTYLLNLLVANLLWNVAYYIGMKIVHGEFKRRSWIYPAVYFGLAGIFGGWAMKYFVDVAAQWELPPAESITFNQKCLNIFWIETYPYDSHDAWHFLSATAIFFSFIGLLVLDDDLITTPTTQISVF